MISKRLKTIASLIDQNEIVLDVGTDHAYLLIYLHQKNISKAIYGSDISEKVLRTARNNLKKFKLESQIPLILSDGLNEINFDFTTLVIAGMGFSTIKKILSNKTLSNKIIIQTNSEQYNLRKFMNNLGYSIDKEIALYDKKIYYNIIKYTKVTEKLPTKYLMYGKSFNKEYYLFLKNKYKNILTKLPFTKKIIYMYKIQLLNSLLKENRV